MQRTWFKGLDIEFYFVTLNITQPHYLDNIEQRTLVVGGGIRNQIRCFSESNLLKLRVIHNKLVLGK